MNNKLSLSLAALVAAGIFAIYSAPSFAAVGATVPPKTPCTVNCGPTPGGDPTSPGDPWFPPGGDGDDTEDGNGPDGGPGDPDDDPEDGNGPDGGPGDGDGPEDGDGPDGGPGGDPGEPGNDPDYPGLTKQEVAELKACLARLDGLPQVSESQINQFGQPYKVTLTPVCETQSLTEVGAAFIENGNVFGLEPALKGNEAIKAKLGQTAYKARDVVGIDFDDQGNATLFVHKKRG